MDTAGAALTLAPVRDATDQQIRGLWAPGWAAMAWPDEGFQRHYR